MGQRGYTLYFSRKFDSKIVKIKFQLVEEVSEGKFSVAEVQKILKNVDQMFYQDIVEERSGNDCCGYLLCDKECIYMCTRFAPELSGQHCLGPVLVRFLSGYTGKFCLASVRCRGFLSVCPDFVCRDSVRCPDSVSIFQKKSVRPDKDKTEVSGFLLSLST